MIENKNVTDSGQNLNILLSIPLYMDVPQFVYSSGDGYLSF